MNSNRMKYASTPTYGMQKRNFAKKQATAQAAPAPDFTQQPALDADNAAATFSPQSPFLPPVGAFMGAAIPPANQNYFPPQNMAGPGMPSTVQNPFAPAQSQVPFGAFTQQNSGAPAYPPLPIGAQNMSGSPFSPREQGFTPNGYPQNGPMTPTVIRGDASGSYAGMPGGPAQNGYGNLPPMGNSYPPNAPMAGYGSMQPPNSIPGISPYPNTGFAAMPGVGNAFGGSALPPAGAMPNQQGYNNPSFPPAMMNAPMNMGPYSRQPFPGQEGGAAAPTPRPPVDIERWLKVMLFGALPVLFLPCLFVAHSLDFLRYLFIIATVVTLSIVWYRQSFTSAMRTTLSVVYLALSIIVIAMLVNSGRDVQRTAPLSALTANQQTAEPAASVEASPLTPQETPSPEEDLGKSEAEQRLTTFMDYWAANRVEDMVNLIQPSWASTQDSPAQALFNVISNRTPLDYTIESISGTSADSSRTITMSSSIDKNNGKDPVRYRFMILMVKEGGEWYIDPNSMATNDAVASPTPTVSGKEAIVQSLAPRMTVTPIPAPDTKLYYNANGGTYYHIDPNCSAVNPKYLPMASFLYSELDSAPYSSLTPCLKCGAPTQSLASLSEATAATATPAP